jgi:hypothetical protein
METGAHQDQPPHVPEPDCQARLHWSGPARAALIFTGVVLPTICFAISYPKRPEWQSGNLDAYAQLLLSHKGSMPLYPLLLYSMTCMTLLVFAPDRFVKKFVVRFGVYTGVLLAVQYWLVFGVALVGGDPAELFTLAFFSLIAVGIPWPLAWALVLLVRRYGQQALWIIAAPVLGLSIVIAAATGDPGLIVGFPFVILFVCLACATPWAVASYTVMAIFAARHSGVERLRFSLARLMGVVTWAAAFFGAWRTSVLLMLEEYAKLPTTPPPSCYVCTAAARGHRRLVGAEQYVGPGGRVYHVNDQMRYLKAAELLLAAICPGVHRTCRRAYDRIGPRLAAMLIHPLLADVAYLLLKPPEWLARVALTLLLRDNARWIHSLYLPGNRSSSDCDPAARSEV